MLEVPASFKREDRLEYENNRLLMLQEIKSLGKRSSKVLDEINGMESLQNNMPQNLGVSIDRIETEMGNIYDQFKRMVPQQLVNHDLNLQQPRVPRKSAAKRLVNVEFPVKPSNLKVFDDHLFTDRPHQKSFPNTVASMVLNSSVMPSPCLQFIPTKDEQTI